MKSLVVVRRPVTVALLSLIAVVGMLVGVPVATPAVAVGDEAGTVTRVFGGGAGDGGPAVAASLDPQAFAVAQDGSFVVWDGQTRQVRRVDAATGRIDVLFGAAVRTAGAVRPSDGADVDKVALSGVRNVWVDDAGRVYLQDADALWRVDPDDRRLVRVSRVSSSHLSWVHGVNAVLGDGTILVSRPATTYAGDAVTERIPPDDVYGASREPFLDRQAGPMAEGPDGTLYELTDSGVLRHDGGGTTELVAGTDSPRPGGTRPSRVDGIPALGAPMEPDAITVGPDGLISYLEWSGQARDELSIRTFTVGGSVTTVARADASADGVLGGDSWGPVVARDGEVVVGTADALRAYPTDGSQQETRGRVLAGLESFGNGRASSPDGTPTDRAFLQQVEDVARDPRDGSLLVGTSNAVYRIPAPGGDGHLDLLAGGPSATGTRGVAVPVGEALVNPRQVDALADGTVLVLDRSYQDDAPSRLLLLDPDHVLREIAGGGDAPITEGAAAAGTRLSYSLNNMAVLAGGRTLVVPNDIGTRRAYWSLDLTEPTPTWRRFAGGGTKSPQDGMPATEADLYSTDVVAAPNGDAILAGNTHEVWRVDAQGVLRMRPSADTWVEGAGVDGSVYSCVKASLLRAIPDGRVVVLGGDGTDPYAHSGVRLSSSCGRVFDTGDGGLLVDTYDLTWAVERVESPVQPWPTAAPRVTVTSRDGRLVARIETEPLPWAISGRLSLTSATPPTQIPTSSNSYLHVDIPAGERSVEWELDRLPSTDPVTVGTTYHARAWLWSNGIVAGVPPLTASGTVQRAPSAVASTVTVQVSPPVALGQQYPTVSARVLRADGRPAAPGGRVTFLANLKVESGGVIGSNGYAHGDLRGLPAGTYTVTARYLGDGQTKPSDSAAVTHLVTEEPGGLQPVTPARVLSSHRLPAGGSTRVTPPGRPEGATAVVLAVRASSTARATSLAGCAGELAADRCAKAGLVPVPATSSRTSHVVARLAPDGSFVVRAGSGTTYATADVVGWYGPATHVRTTAQAPRRALTSKALGAGSSSTLTPPGRPTGAVAAWVTLRATAGANTTNVNACAGDVAATTCRSRLGMRVTPRQTVASTMLVPLAADGTIRVANSAGTSTVTVDVRGWETAGSWRSLHAADGLRSTTGLSVGSGRTAAFTVPGAPGNAKAVLANVRVDSASATTSVSLCPGGSSTTACKSADDVVVPWKGTGSSLTVVPLGPGGKLTLYNSAGTSKVTVDVVAWLT